MMKCHKRLTQTSMSIESAIPRTLLHSLMSNNGHCCLIHMHACNTHSLEEYGDGIGLATYPPYSWMSITHNSEKIDSEILY